MTFALDNAGLADLIRRTSGGLSNQPGFNQPGNTGGGGTTPPAPPPTTPVPTPGTGTDTSAKALIQGALNDYGLGALADWAWQRYLAGIDVGQIMIELRDQQAYKDRFPYMEALRQKGHAITEGEAIATERSMAQLMRQYGLPEGYYDQPSDFAAFISNEVSVSELSSRLAGWQQFAYDVDPGAREQLRDLYGVTDGDLLAFFNDPDRALPTIMQKARGAQVAASSVRSGFGALTADEATRLSWMDPQDAAAGFGRLSALREVLTALPGEQGDGMGRETAFAAAFEGNQQAQEQITRRQKGRVSPFQQGGGFSTSRAGYSGVGGA